MVEHVAEAKTALDREESVRYQSFLNSISARGLNSTLNQYQPTADKPWNKKRIAHLLKRTGYGAHIDRIDSLSQLTPSQAVDEIIQQSIDASLPETPSWIDETPPYPFNGQYALANQERAREFKIAWTDEMRKAPLRERLAFFWRNHFVISSHNDIFAPLWHRYLTVIRTHTFGNFKEFAKAIGLDHGMLIFLDGQMNSSRDQNPQENYAREFLELFLMGITDKHGKLNYTQKDISELAKAFSGYAVRLRPEFEVTYDPDRFFDEDKTILGRTGNFDYEEAIEVVFEERAEEIAYYICRKLYRWFVYEGANDEIVEKMADLFLSSDFEILPVISALLKSEHFFDEDIMGAKIKSPIEFLNALYVETGIEPDQSLKERQERWLRDLGQDPIDAPNVAGWPGYHLWLDNTTVTHRWNIARRTLTHMLPNNAVDVVGLSRKIAGNDAGDPEKLAMHLTQYFISVPLPDSETADFKDVLLNGIPDDEWDIDESGAEQHILGFIQHLRELPEYNLF
jgi:uncharacterized protein (DUF1800 family)